MRVYILLFLLAILVRPNLAGDASSYMVFLFIPAMLVGLRVAGDASSYSTSVHTCHVSDSESGW